MNDRTCPVHPDQETMVPCLGCGRYFCRICDPPKGAGQYCPACYEDSLTRIAGKGVRRFSPFTRRGAAGKPEGPVPPDPEADAGAECPATSVEGPRPAGAKRPPPPAVRKPVPAAERRPLPPEARVARRPSAARKPPEKRAGQPDEKPGRVKEGLAPARHSAAQVKDRAKKAARAVPRLPERGWAYAKAHFPFHLTGREKMEGMPPLAGSWLRLLIVTLGGALLWVGIVVLWRHRNPAVYIVVAVAVSLGVVYSMGARFGLQAAVVATCLALLSLVIGELLVLMLYRLNVIRELDIRTVTKYVVETNKTELFYPEYFKNLILFKLLPSAVAAFLVAWWPLPKRVAWRGFSAAAAQVDAGEEAV